MTRYLVYARIEEIAEAGTYWQYVTEVVARSSRAAVADAVSQTAEQDVSNGREFVAVPARSWKPVTVKVETKTALKFS